MKVSGIYGIFSTESRKWYIGQSVDIKNRKLNHFGALRKGSHKNFHLQGAFNKYGEADFEFHIIERVNEDLLDVREKSWIAHYKSTSAEYGYNSDDGGKTNKHCSESHKLNISKKLKGRPQHENTRRAWAKTRANRKLEEKCWVPERL